MLTNVLNYDLTVSRVYLKQSTKLRRMFREQRLDEVSQESGYGHTVFILKIGFAAELLPAWLYGLLLWAAPLRFLLATLGISLSPGGGLKEWETICEFNTRELRNRSFLDFKPESAAELGLESNRCSDTQINIGFPWYIVN